MDLRTRPRSSRMRSFIAGRGRRLSEWFLRPRLELFWNPGDTGEKLAARDKKLRLYHLHVRNRGRVLAPSCAATLDRFEHTDGKGWFPHPGFRNPMPLRGEGQAFSPSLPLVPGAVHRFELATIARNEVSFRFVEWESGSSGNLLRFPTGTYRLTITLRGGGEEWEPLTRRFLLQFEGHWTGFKLEALP